LQKAHVTFVVTVCPSGRIYQCGFHWLCFFVIWYWGLLWKSVEKIRIWSNWTEILGIVH